MKNKNLIRHPILRNAFIALMLILSFNKLILPALGLTITGITIQQGPLTTPTLSGFSLSSSSVVYGTSAPTITAPTSASSGAITYTSGNTAVATISGSTITIVGAGTAIISATQAAARNYGTATATVSLTVTSATPVLSGFALSSTNLADDLPAPTITPPTSSSNGAITYSSSDATIATISGSTITIVGSVNGGNDGTVIITANQTASGNYASASASVSLTITAPMCNGNGTPVAGVGGSYTCSCNVPFFGASCNQILLIPGYFQQASLKSKALIPMLLASLSEGQ